MTTIWQISVKGLYLQQRRQVDRLAVAGVLGETVVGRSGRLGRGRHRAGAVDRLSHRRLARLDAAGREHLRVGQRARVLVIVPVLGRREVVSPVACEKPRG